MCRFFGVSDNRFKILSTYLFKENLIHILLISNDFLFIIIGAFCHFLSVIYVILYM